MTNTTTISWTICKSFALHPRQITMPAHTPFLIFNDCMLFLLPNQQCQSTGGIQKAW